jgi:L-threonylcarbamoyladenylate synthase
VSDLVRPVCLDPNKMDRSQVVRQCAEALIRGELVVLPTDTVYGVAAAVGCEDGLFRAKVRAPGKPIPLLAAGIAAVEGFGAMLSSEERRLAGQFWPGPLTLILRMSHDRQGADREEGFRVPDHSLAREIIGAAGGVLRVTSANRSGEPPATTAAAAMAALEGSVTVVVDDGPVGGGVPSTVARLRGREVEVLRDGGIQQSALERIAGGELL